MQVSGSNNSTAALTRLKAAQAEVGASQQRLLEAIAECDRDGTWLADGCRDFAQWISAQLGISNWSARRWVTAAEALPGLTEVRSALGSGTLSIDKVLELGRFAEPGTERRLVSWAKRVTPATIRRRGDVAGSPDRKETIESDRSRYLDYWWTDDGRRFWLEGSWPSDQGAVIAKSLDRMAGRLPDIVDTEEDAEPASFAESLVMRRADALVALASHRIAADADRATVVVHVDVETLAADHGGCEIEGGGVAGAETARRLACDGRIEFAFHDCSGHTVGVDRASRTPSPWLVRQLRHRDRGCTFPGCDARWFLQCHHIWHWGKGGPTDLDNLVLTCGLHHKLVHEYGWDVELGSDDVAIWRRPDGTPFDPASVAPPSLDERALPRVAGADLAMSFA
ncbi:HNH endonuclease signature motif containing protein [soil metagenome]